MWDTVGVWKIRSGEDIVVEGIEFYVSDVDTDARIRQVFDEVVDCIGLID